MGATGTTTIRRRSGHDLAAVRRLADDVLRLDGYPPRTPDDLGTFLAGSDPLASFVAVVDGRVVGQVCVNPSSSPEVDALAERVTGLPMRELAVVARLLVSPEHRREGIARALLAEALAEITRLGRTPVLDVATHLVGAIGLYERTGWRRSGQVTVAIGEQEPLEEYLYLGPA